MAASFSAPFMRPWINPTRVAEKFPVKAAARASAAVRSSVSLSSTKGRPKNLFAAGHFAADRGNHIF